MLVMRGKSLLYKEVTLNNSKNTCKIESLDGKLEIMILKLENRIRWKI
jgi:hypothetical protein